MAVLAMAAAACGDPAAIPELTATPLPESSSAATSLDVSAADQEADGSVLAATDDGEAEPEPTPPPDPEPTAPPAPQADAPSPSHDAQRAAFLYANVEDVLAADHLSTNLVGDDVPELVLATLSADGALDVTLAAWGGHEYERTGAVSAGAAHKVGTPVARDLTRDGRLEIVAPFTAEGGPAVLAVAVADDGALTVPSRCPVPEPAKHHLRLRTSRAVTAVVLSCDAGTATDDVVLLQWRGGLFVVPPAQDAAAADQTEREAGDRGRPPHAGPPDDTPVTDRHDRKPGPPDDRGRGPGEDRDREDDRPGRGERD